jgi:hypothetical protein
MRLEKEHIGEWGMGNGEWLIKVNRLQVIFKTFNLSTLQNLQLSTLY